MKKLLAMLLALLMMLSGFCTALAEPSTAYYVSVADPIVYYNGEPILDMTGLNVDLGAMVTDVGCFALQALAFVGENYDIQALGAQAQLDTNGLTFSLNGMEKIYSIDLSQYTYGFDVTSLLPSIPAYTFLNTPIEMESVSFETSLAMRYDNYTSVLAEFIQEDGTIAIDKTQGELIVNRALTALETAGEAMNVDGIAEIRAQQIAFDFDGALTTTGDPAANTGSLTIEGSGHLYTKDMAEGLPFDLKLSDSTEATNLTLNAHEDTDSAVIAMDCAYTTASDGREGFDCSVTVTVNDVEEMLFNMSATPVEDSRQTDYVLSMQIPSEQADLAFVLSTGTNGDDLGFALDMFVTAEEETAGLYLYYNGEKTVDEYGTLLNGYVSAGAEYNGETAGIDTYLMLQAYDTDSAEWAYDSTGAIALETMTDEEASALEIGLMGVVGTAFTAISENVPGLAPIITSVMG